MDGEGEDEGGAISIKQSRFRQRNMTYLPLSRGGFPPCPGVGGFASENFAKETGLKEVGRLPELARTWLALSLDVRASVLLVSVSEPVPMSPSPMGDRLRLTMKKQS